MQYLDHGNRIRVHFSEPQTYSFLKDATRRRKHECRLFYLEKRDDVYFFLTIVCDTKCSLPAIRPPEIDPRDPSVTTLFMPPRSPDDCVDPYGHYNPDCACFDHGPQCKEYRRVVTREDVEAIISLVKQSCGSWAYADNRGYL